MKSHEFEASVASSMLLFFDLVIVADASSIDFLVIMVGFICDPMPFGVLIREARVLSLPGVVNAGA